MSLGPSRRALSFLSLPLRVLFSAHLIFLSRPHSQHHPPLRAHHCFFLTTLFSCQNLPVSRTTTLGPSRQTNSQSPVMPTAVFSALFPNRVPSSLFACVSVGRTKRQQRFAQKRHPGGRRWWEETVLSTAVLFQQQRFCAPPACCVGSRQERTFRGCMTNRVIFKTHRETGREKERERDREGERARAPRRCLFSTVGTHGGLHHRQTRS